jgi:LPS export ABC transporter protein LptC
MTRPRLHLLQGVLLASAATTVVAVGLSLRARPRPAPSPSARVTDAARPGTSRMDDLVFRKLDKDGRERFVLRAERMLGQEQEDLRLRGVSLSFPYLARGESGSGSITANACLYTPALQKAVFTGNVVVTTEDGLEVHTESLVYRGDKGLARTESALRFKRKQVSGSATGAVYQAEEGVLELLADAVVQVADEHGPTLVVRGQHAVAKREENTLRFGGDVLAERGGDSLSSQDLVVYFTPEQAFDGFSAMGEVKLRSIAGSSLPGLAGSGRGRGLRTLTCQRLHVSVRSDQSLDVATAGPDAVLVLMPGPGEAPEQRRVEARILTFQFDEKGRLSEIHGQKESLLAIEALPPAQAPPRTLASRSFTARLDPETGETRIAEFNNDVVVHRGGQTATSEDAWFDRDKQRLTLTGDPELADADGGRLSAEKIEIGTVTGDVTASRGVRHLLGRNAARRPGLLQRREAPSLVTCGTFSYEARSLITRYLDGAVMRSGNDEIRAPLIRGLERPDGSRRIAALQGVVSVFHPRTAPGQKSAAPVEVRGTQMVYDEGERQLVYTGEVGIRQGDLVSHSPTATATLSADGSEVETLVAGEPVEIQQGTRTVTGTRATYVPVEERLVVVGEKVLLKEPGRDLTGRSLTFHAGDGRILVDGHEEVRTESILRKQSPKP